MGQRGAALLISAALVAVGAGAMLLRTQLAPGTPFDLTRLSPSAQATVSLLLVLPYGVLVTAVFRNIVGVFTFGTFTSSLIALSVTDTDWRLALAILVGVLLVGIGGRRLLNRLQLLMVPRLGLVITASVLYIAAALAVFAHFGLMPDDPRVVLLPTVILTAMIERFHVSAEENGLRLASSQLGWTLFVGICCCGLFAQAWLRRFALVYPESLFFVAAALLLLGRYGGYRLVELWRFRELAAGKK